MSTVIDGASLGPGDVFVSFDGVRLLVTGDGHIGIGKQPDGSLVLGRMLPVRTDDLTAGQIFVGYNQIFEVQ